MRFRVRWIYLLLFILVCAAISACGRVKEGTDMESYGSAAVDEEQKDSGSTAVDEEQKESGSAADGAEERASGTDQEQDEMNNREGNNATEGTNEHASGAEQGQNGVKNEADNTADTEAADSRVEQQLAEMTLEQKVCQMFFITPEALTGVDAVTQAGDVFRAAYAAHPVGGIVFFDQNLVSGEQTKSMLEGLQSFAEESAAVPVWTGVDEEGGTVVRVAGKEGFSAADVGDMKDIGATGDPRKAYDAYASVGAYLSALGFNLDFAPVADVLVNPDNTVVADRSFGTDATLVSEMTVQAVQGLESAGVGSVLKHFPGHGSTLEDSHYSAARSDRTLQELTVCEFLPFEAGIQAGADMVMVGHISSPEITGDMTPACLSATMVTDVLRGQLGYQGIVITDAMDMQAVSDNYAADKAAVDALQAGVDVILMPEDFTAAYEGVLDAVKDGTLSEERIDASVRRILTSKENMSMHEQWQHG